MFEVVAREESDGLKVGQSYTVYKVIVSSNGYNVHFLVFHGNRFCLENANYFIPSEV